MAAGHVGHFSTKDLCTEHVPCTSKTKKHYKTLCENKNYTALEALKYSYRDIKISYGIINTYCQVKCNAVIVYGEWIWHHLELIIPLAKMDDSHYEPFMCHCYANCLCYNQVMIHCVC